jgi:hypothetical protein
VERVVTRRAERRCLVVDPSADPLGPDRRSVLEEFAARSTVAARTRRLDAVAEEVLAAFERAEIQVRFLKGIVLSRLLYRPGEVRGYYDIDVIVDPAQLAAAGRVLEALGHQNVSVLDGVVDVAGILHAQVWVKSHADFGNVTVDLHWTMAGCAVSPETAWSVLSADPQYVSVGISRLPTLPPAGLALHLSLHAAQHGPDDSKAIGDLRRGLGRWPVEVWRQAAGWAERLAAVDSLAAGLRLTPEGRRLADEQLELPDSSLRLAEIELKGRRPRGTFHIEAFAAADTWGDRASVIRHALLPTPTWIQREYRWARRGPLYLSLAYGVHVLRSPRWAAQALTFRREVRRRSSEL